MFRRSLLLCLAVLTLPGVIYLMAADSPLPDQRAAAQKLYDQGNWRDAYEIFSKLALSRENAGQTLADDFSRGLQCLVQLQQWQQDEFRENVIATHAEDWKLLKCAAQSYLDTNHYGYIVAGEFERGNQRGGGEYASSVDRDRARALQLFQQALPLVNAADATPQQQAEFYRQFGEAWQFDRTHHNAWRLQDLTDLESLPDYYHWSRWGHGHQNVGAAVNADGQPVYFTIPDSLEAATSDGQRWRWCLAQMVKQSPDLRAKADWIFANFLHEQFGVQTMRQWGIVLPQADGADGDRDESGPYALHSLGENETIARLANGVKRFTMPDEFNPIAIYKRLADGKSGYAETAHATLAQIFEDRQQYPKAEEWWRKNIERFKDDQNQSKQKRLNQIIGNWGAFENVPMQPAGTGATVEYRFRNAKQVAFTAQAIKIDQLLADVKAYLKSNPRELDWNKMQIGNIGHRLVEENQTKYLGEQVADWQLELEPRPEHFDRRITVTTPLQKAGAYLVTAKLADGNTSRIILWLADTAIVKKQLNGQALYFIADAASGKPVEKANVEFFGWRQEQVPNTRNQYRLVTSNFAEFTDAEGMTLPDPKQLGNNFQWLITARTDSGRLAYLGFSHVWYGNYHNQQYHENKTFVVTDRPVYRPDQKVQFKFWMRETKYDLPDSDRFANLPFTVRIHDPEGTEVYKQQYTTDEYGGLAGEFALPKGAKLGQYNLAIDHAHGVSGGGSFRVEEYKKPEFEVTVEAPTEPVQLRDKITATIRAKYYFGAPVTNAKVKFKVERTPHDARWYPAMPWDWLYGEGYWWFASDYEWYRGFGRWGCIAPRPFWFPWHADPPELVLDQEVEIGEDGTVKVEIDTALAQALHGDEDHKYSITAEVVDASRRTIVGTGEVLVARQPFKVFVWTTRGHYRVGDTIHAHFQARTLDGKGVAGKGKLKLLRITYDNNGNPVENVAQEWDLDPNADGAAAQEIKASEPGQYRLSYVVESPEKKDETKSSGVAAEGDRSGLSTLDSPLSIEGGYLFVIRGDGFDGSEFQFNDLELVTDKTEYSPGDKVQLLINTNRVGSSVLLFLRPANGLYAGRPQLIKLNGKSTTVEVDVIQKDMPNFFVEAVTIAAGKVHTVVREVIVPPEQRVLNVEVLPNQASYLPGAEAKVRVKVTDDKGEAYVGSVVLAAYDRALEYISGGSNVPEIRAFFWKWRRQHHPQTEDNLDDWFWNLVKSGELTMQNLGAFGDLVADTEEKAKDKSGADAGAMEPQLRGLMTRKSGASEGMSDSFPAAAPMAAPVMEMAADALSGGFGGGAGGAPQANLVQPTIRQNFADTAYWNAALTTNKKGIAKVSFDMPEDLSDWKLRAWGMGHGTRVGEGSVTVPTKKNLIVRLQAPRFFVEKDEVVLSAIVHNFLDEEKQAQVELVLDGDTLELVKGQVASVEGTKSTLDPRPSTLVQIPAGGETRVDWRCKVIAEGTAKITMQALTDEESDAMQQTFPVYVHGFLKTESFSGVVRAKETNGVIEFNVPADRRAEQTRLEVRYSPTLAGAMVDALPYLVEYPYGCTEQTLNRFVPTVITQSILKRMGVNLADIQAKRTNLNAQEIGNDVERAKQWKHWKRNPV
ncbi:MAG: alpha-2-macroglobulin family protein, partial [Planctomycetaceae bacterium]